jgi:hypothetical protein
MAPHAQLISALGTAENARASTLASNKINNSVTEPICPVSAVVSMGRRDEFGAGSGADWSHALWKIYDPGSENAAFCYETDLSRSRRLFLICLVVALTLSPLVLNWVDVHTDYTPQSSNTLRFERNNLGSPQFMGITWQQILKLSNLAPANS